MYNNDFFHIEDYNTLDWYGYKIPLGWWSRRYEYPWAGSWSATGETVADMGCGAKFRPLKHYLARRNTVVYGVDFLPSKEPVLPKNFVALAEDFTTKTSIAGNSIDRLFCISTLEEVKNIEMALVEFKRVLTPGGIMVLTLDMAYDESLPTPKYNGLHIEKFIQNVANVGLNFVGSVHADRDYAVSHKELNLCVFHCILTS